MFANKCRREEEKGTEVELVRFQETNWRRAEVNEQMVDEKIGGYNRKSGEIRHKMMDGLMFTSLGG